MSSTQQRLSRLAIGIVSAGAALTLVACSSSGGAATNTQGASDANTSAADVNGSAPRDLGTVNVINTAAHNVEEAADLGFFAKYGLKVNVKHLLNGPAVLAALQGGSGDIGYADFYAGINANAQGFKLDLVNGRNGNEGDKVLYVKANSDINTPADLAGKSIIISPIPQAKVNLLGYLKANGVDASKVKIKTTQGSSLNDAALKNGTADATQGSWSNVYQSEGAFKAIGKPDSSGWSEKGATSAGFWSTDKYAQSHKDVVTAFSNGIKDFQRWLHSVKPATNAALNDKYEGTSWTKLAGGDPTKLAQIATVDNLETGPFDFTASQNWYDLGVQYAPDSVKTGVDLHKIVFESSLIAEPTGDFPAAAVAFAKANGS